MTVSTTFGSRRIYYNNFAAHLLNAFNPNMLYPELPYRWSDEDWRRMIDMVAGFGYTTFEFWLVPRLFCREGLASPFGHAFVQQMRAVIEHAHTRRLQVELIAGLATVGADWRTYCPNVPTEWQEVRRLWDTWTRLLPVDIAGIFPGDPGACSRNGCTALTYIDRSIEIAEIVTHNLPEAEIEFHTWGPPFFGWGNIQAPEGWQGEFIVETQHTAWDFDRRRAEESMAHLLRRLPDFPDRTSVAINMGFNSDGNPVGDEDARPWITEIAKTHPVQSWDFSLTEGENNVVPHYRFARLFERRREERACDAYSGGICFTMSPLLNQLSLYMAAQSFMAPDASPDSLAATFYARLFGMEGCEIVPYLPLFEVIKDWGNYHDIDLPRKEYHRRMRELAELLDGLAGHERDDLPLFPDPAAYRETLHFYARLFADLSAPSPDFDTLRERYWRRVYAIYDHLPAHVDPRPHQATDRLIGYFAEGGG
jgi:hypothetical protein